VPPSIRCLGRGWTERCVHTQDMIANVPGRGLVDFVPAHMLVSGPDCKAYCYENFIMCGDHRAQTESKLDKWNAANKLDYCKQQKEICNSQC
jgi:hypothetical protein